MMMVTLVTWSIEHDRRDVCDVYSHHHYNLDFDFLKEINPGKVDYESLHKVTFKFIHRFFTQEYHNPNRIAQK